MLRIGIDLGGTKIECVGLLEDGSESPRVRVATPAGNYEGTIKAVVDAVAQCRAAAGTGPVRIGLGHPGSRSPRTGLHRNANSTCLNGRDLVGDCSRGLGQEVRASNDANCFALAEALDGAGRGARVVFGVILGTGVGGGVVINGRALDGRNFVAGEWGHSPQPGATDEERRERPCYCGQHGCIETFCAGPSVEAENARSSPRRTVAELGAASDATARQCVERLIDRLSAALAGVVNLLDPDCIVLGGGVSNLPALYDGRLSAATAARVFGGEFETPIVKAQHGDSAGVRGAAALWAPGE